MVKVLVVTGWHLVVMSDGWMLLMVVMIVAVGGVLQQEVGSVGSIGEECWVVLVMMMVISGHGGWS